MKNTKFDLNDITIVPAVLSDIDSRSEIGLEYFPLFVAPMDTVLSNDNFKLFKDLGFNICMPRGEKVNDLDVFVSFGLDEIIDIVNAKKVLPKKVLIDIANGHLRKLFNISKRIKEEYDVILMIGNIANPETYRLYSDIGVDYIRCSIGSGNNCITSANTSIHYPLASLIKECYDISCELKTPAKIVADGGFRNYDEVIKALALGADYVMLGSILSKTLEACSDNYVLGGEFNYIKIDNGDAVLRYKKSEDVYKYYRGMSTKEVQKKWGRKELKTSEGISKYNKVEYTAQGWTENFTDYLKSAMSYCNSRNLNAFIGKVQYIFITEQARNRYMK